MNYITHVKNYVIYTSENNKPSQFTAVINTKNNMIMTAQITISQNGNNSIVLNSNGPTTYYCIDLGKYFNDITLNFDAKIGEFVINACDNGVEYTMFLDKNYHGYKVMVDAFNKELDNDNNPTDAISSDINTDNAEVSSTIKLLKDGKIYKYEYSTLVYDSSENVIGTITFNCKNISNYYELIVELYFTKSNETNSTKFYLSPKELIKYLPFDKCIVTFDYDNNTLIAIKIYPVNPTTGIKHITEIPSNDTTNIGSKSDELSASTFVNTNTIVKDMSNINGIQVYLMK